MERVHPRCDDGPEHRPGGRGQRSGRGGTLRRTDSADVPVPPAAIRLLARSDAELVAAQFAGSDDERFVHAHLAALRAGAALLAVVGRPIRRRNPRSVWDLVALAEPGLAGWTAFFADGAAARSAVEAGRDGVVDAARAEATLSAAEDFQDAVRRRIGDRDASGSLGLRAS